MPEVLFSTANVSSLYVKKIVSNDVNQSNKRRKYFHKYALWNTLHDSVLYYNNITGCDDLMVQGLYTDDGAYKVYLNSSEPTKVWTLSGFLQQKLPTWSRPYQQNVGVSECLIVFNIALLNILQPFIFTVFYVYFSYKCLTHGIDMYLSKQCILRVLTSKAHTYSY